MKKKLFLLFLLAVAVALPSSAVLKEANIDSTLNVLRMELTNYRLELERETGMMQEQQQEIGANLLSVMNRSNQNSLMLYSQKSEYIFDLTYACHEATEQYNQFTQNVLPFRQFITNTDQEIARYDSLINNLSQMYAQSLSPRGRIDRNVCLTLAINIRRTLKANSEQMQTYITYYNMTEKQLKNLNDYAIKRYSDIQSNIFSNGGTNYFNVLSQLGQQIHQSKEIFIEKYLTNRKAKSQWDFKYIFWLFMALFIYACIAVALNFAVMRWLMPNRLKSETFMAKRTCITLATSSVTLAIILMLLRFFSHQNFIIMASGILVEYTWLQSVILISLLLRLDSAQIKSAFRLYSPIMAVGFIIIAFRVVLIPNELVNLLLPPILLAATLWQWNVMSRHSKNVPKSDVFYIYISQAVFIVSVIASWLGYTLFAVQLLIWWVMQLTCILTLTCISGWLNDYARRRKLSEQPITKTWLYNLVKDTAVPILGAFSFIISLYWAADVFNLSDTTWMLFNRHFIDTKNFSASLFNIVQAITLYFIFRYINRTAQAMLRLHFEQSDRSTAASRNVMAKNVVQLLVWGIWLLITLAIFKISNTWLVVVSGGLSTGIGFAMKDILENIYYGVSLMAGRVKIGDYIVVDNIRGRVSSISYTSTMVEATDGSVIAFQNSQLFTKNYKNMTKNHGYELDILEVGVAYGTDIPKVKQLLHDAIMQLDCIYKKRDASIVLKSFDDSSINLKILVWVPVLSQYSADGKVLECVYKTLNDHHIEIPFPQRDIHIIHADDTEQAEAEERMREAAGKKKGTPT